KRALDLLHKARQLETAEKDVWQLRQAAAACLGDFVGLEPTIWPQKEPAANTWHRPIALQPNGTHLAVGLEDGTVLVRDIASGAEIARLPGPSPSARVGALAFDPDGRWLVSAHEDGKGTINVWEPKAQTGWAHVRSHKLGAAVSSVAITPDG